VQPPNGFIADLINDTGTNATSPVMGRLLVVMCADFTMKPLRKAVLG
jgi:small neutral amino acid transporter SnatA (MarC family)